MFIGQSKRFKSVMKTKGSTSSFKNWLLFSVKMIIFIKKIHNMQIFLEQSAIFI